MDAFNSNNSVKILTTEEEVNICKKYYLTSNYNLLLECLREAHDLCLQMYSEEKLKLEQSIQNLSKEYDQRKELVNKLYESDSNILYEKHSRRLEKIELENKYNIKEIENSKSIEDLRDTLKNMEDSLLDVNDRIKYLNEKYQQEKEFLSSTIQKDEMVIASNSNTGNIDPNNLELPNLKADDVFKFDIQLSPLLTPINKTIIPQLLIKTTSDHSLNSPGETKNIETENFIDTADSLENVSSADSTNLLASAKTELIENKYLNSSIFDELRDSTQRRRSKLEEIVKRINTNIELITSSEINEFESFAEEYEMEYNKKQEKIEEESERYSAEKEIQISESIKLELEELLTLENNKVLADKELSRITTELENEESKLSLTLSSLINIFPKSCTFNCMLTKDLSGINNLSIIHVNKAVNQSNEYIDIKNTDIDLEINPFITPIHYPFNFCYKNIEEFSLFYQSFARFLKNPYLFFMFSFGYLETRKSNYLGFENGNCFLLNTITEMNVTYPFEFCSLCISNDKIYDLRTQLLLSKEKYNYIQIADQAALESMLATIKQNREQTFQLWNHSLYIFKFQNKTNKPSVYVYCDLLPCNIEEQDEIEEDFINTYNELKQLLFTNSEYKSIEKSPSLISILQENMKLYDYKYKYLFLSHIHTDRYYLEDNISVMNFAKNFYNFDF